MDQVLRVQRHAAEVRVLWFVSNEAMICTKADRVFFGIDVVEQDVAWTSQVRLLLKFGLQFRKIFVRIAITIARFPMKPPVKTIPIDWIRLEWIDAMNEIVLSAQIPNQLRVPVIPRGSQARM